MRTGLCDLLGIERPIVLAGMAGGSTTPALVAAVSEAGGLGTFGAMGMTAEALRASVLAARALTDAPIAVNVLLADPTPARGDPSLAEEAVSRLAADLGVPAGDPPAPAASAQELIKVALESGADVISCGLGDPAPVVEPARAAGAPVIAMVASVDDARRAVASGADAIVAQGAEAGGHRSDFAVADDGSVPLVGTMALVPQVVDAVGAPVVAAGGIMDGRGVAAALALGAQGAQLGTRFLTTDEAGLPPSYKRRVQNAAEWEPVITTGVSGRPARGIRNRLIDAMEAVAPANAGYPRQMAVTGALRAEAARRDHDELMALWAGQAASLARPGSAAQVVREIVAEAEHVLAGLSGR
jgi:nitronate monooxygenase